MCVSVFHFPTYCQPRLKNYDTRNLFLSFPSQTFRLEKASRVAHEILTTEKNFLAIVKFLNEDFRDFVIKVKHQSARRRSSSLKGAKDKEIAVENNISEEELEKILR